MNLTAVVLTLNEERHIADCLASLAWAPRVVVFDSFSTDRTLALAGAARAEVRQRPWDNYAGQRNAALQAIDSEWVLFVDADERVTPELAQEVESVLNAPQAGWWIPRHNYLFGRLTLHAGWYPDYQLRLLRRARARYDPARPVHELVLLDGEAGHLHAPFIHLNYDRVSEFVAKQNMYAAYDADGLRRQGQRARLHNFVFQPLRQFQWRYFALEGWRDGWHGLRLSLLMALFELEKYRLLWRSQRLHAPPAR